MRKFQQYLCILSVLTSGWVSAADVALTQVIFEDSEPGLGTYVTRLLTNKRYLRIDDGQDDGDYVLFDRVKGEVHNFNHEERIEIIIQRRPPLQLDFDVPMSIDEITLKSAPTINSIDAVEHRFIVNGEVCKTSINFQGLMPQVVTALKQYQDMLQQQNRQTLDEIPDNVKTSCYLVNHYLHSTSHLEGGFPVYLSDNEGKERKLLDFKLVKKSARLLERPDNYRVYYPTLPERD